MYRSRLLLAIVLLISWLSAAAQQPEYIPNQLFVKVKNSSTEWLNWGGHASDVEPSSYAATQLFYSYPVVTSHVPFKTQHPDMQNTYLLDLHNDSRTNELIKELVWSHPEDCRQLE